MLAVVLALPPSDCEDAPADDGKPAAGGSLIAQPVAGLPLLLRRVLTLQKAGLDRILLVVPQGDRDDATGLLADPRIHVPVETVWLDVGEPWWPLVARHTAEPFVLTRLEVVAARELYRALQAAPSTDGSALLVVDGGAPIGLLRVDGSAGELLGQGDEARLLDRLAAVPGVELLDVGSHWWTRADTAAGRARATDRLFEGCRKSVDGVVSRHLNRHVSLFLSKRLVHTPLSPNGATIITFVVGLVACGFVLQGGYLATLVGAALFQLNSILDGVDGELARVRFQQSKLGQWLDTIGDDAALLLFYSALAIGTRELPSGIIWSTAAWIAAATTALSALLYYTELVRIGSGDLYAIEWDFDKHRPRGWRGRVVRFFRTILKQDFFVFVIFCAAVIGVLPYALPVFAAGGVITVAAATVRRLSRARRRQNTSQ